MADLERPKKAAALQGASVIIRTGSEDPLTAFSTRVAFAALASGFDLISDKGFQHSFSADAETAEELEESRKVTWLWDGKKTATFDPDFPRETIGFQEFERRFTSDSWWKENPNHPIAYLRAFLEKSRAGMEIIRALEPTLRHYRDGAVAVAPASATDEEIDDLFRQLDEDPDSV